MRIELDLSHLDKLFFFFGQKDDDTIKIDLCDAKSAEKHAFCFQAGLRPLGSGRQRGSPTSPPWENTELCC